MTASGASAFETPQFDPPQFSTVRGIAENIVVLPYQLGYRPRRSVVMVCLQHHRQHRSRPTGVVQLIARTDLDPPGGAPAVLEALDVALDRARPDVVVLIAFEDPQDDATKLLGAARELAEMHGALVDQPVRVRDQDWCPVLRRQASCGGWQRLPAEADVPSVADYVLRGCSPVADREVLAQLFTSRRPLLRAAVTAEIDERLCSGPGSVDAERAMDLLGQVLRAEGMALPVLVAPVLADLALVLHEVLHRDGVLARTAPGVIRLSDVPPQVAERVVRLVPMLGEVDGGACERLAVLSSHLPGWAAAPLVTVCGYLAWWSGAGTLANLAIARALECDPHYSMALLVDRALAQAVPPPGRQRGVDPPQPPSGPRPAA